MGRRLVIAISQKTEEAQSAIDKLFEYQNSDNGYWRNRMMIFTDMGEEDLFTYQAEGVQKLVNDSLGLAHHIDKMYTEIFNRAECVIFSSLYHCVTQIRDLASGRFR